MAAAVVQSSYSANGSGNASPGRGASSSRHPATRARTACLVMSVMASLLQGTIAEALVLTSWTRSVMSATVVLDVQFGATSWVRMSANGPPAGCWLASGGYGTGTSAPLPAPTRKRLLLGSQATRRLNRSPTRAVAGRSTSPPGMLTALEQVASLQRRIPPCRLSTPSGSSELVLRAALTLTR